MKAKHGIYGKKELLQLSIINIFIWSALFAAASYAQVYNTSTYCVDNTTMITSVYRQICIEFSCDNVTRESPTVCQWGCNIKRGECYPDPTMSYAGVIVVIVAIIVVLYFIRRKLA